MIDEKSDSRIRIPVRFVDADGAAAEDTRVPGLEPSGGEAAENPLTPEEIGRSSSYEDETEVQRRIDRGAETDDPAGRERADDADVAGAPDPADLPERREDQDTLASAEEAAGGPTGDVALDHEAHAGPVLAELLASRGEIKRLEAELQKAAAERQSLLDRLARSQADFDNYRKRTERERIETYNRIVGNVVRKLLPVVDNLHRALDAVGTVQDSEAEEVRHFVQGVELIARQLNDVLASMGVQPVPTVGEPFDPNIHEAIATEETDQFEPDTVTQEIVRGYRLGDSLLRPAMVKVARK